MTLRLGFARNGLLALALVFPGIHMANGAATSVGVAQAATGIVANFDTAIWRQWMRLGSKPAAYVFSNAFCTVCPEVFELLQQTVAPQDQPIDRTAVLMDGQGDRALATASHSPPAIARAQPRSTPLTATGLHCVSWWTRSGTTSRLLWCWSGAMAGCNGSPAWLMPGSARPGWARPNWRWERNCGLTGSTGAPHWSKLLTVQSRQPPLECI